MRTVYQNENDSNKVKGMVACGSISNFRKAEKGGLQAFSGAILSESTGQF